MASFLPSSDPGANITVTKEEFNLFHNIDRQLFTRLVVGLARETSQSAHVMAFIMWLEKKTKDYKMVENLLHWPDNLLNDLADESVLAMNCIERSQFPYDSDKVLPLIHSISSGTMTLRYLHDNRIEIIPAVTKLLNDVCTRAFTDIVQQVQFENAMKQQNYNAATFFGSLPSPFLQPVLYYAAAPAPGVAILPQPVAVPVAQWPEGGASIWAASNSHPLDAARRNDLNEGFKDILATLQSGPTRAAIAIEKKVVPADERTLFLTFSKGYPISETEVRDFFARTHGNIIEAIYMQDTQQSLEKQPLFARMVVRAEAMYMIDSFLDATGKVKFSINGKHVWARRYVRKGNKSPRATSPVTFRPPSPPAAAGTSY